MKFNVLWIAGLLLAATAGRLQAGVMTFEDVPGGSIQNTFGEMLTYQGFNFIPISVGGLRDLWIDTVGSVWNFGSHSGDFTLLNNFGQITVITDAAGADFTFDGLWAKQWGSAPESGGTDSLFGLLEGYNNSMLVWSVGTSLNGSFEFYGPQAGAIDELHLGFGRFFLVDDISLNAAAAVPEPSSIAMFGVGALGLIFARRNRQQKKLTA